MLEHALQGVNAAAPATWSENAGSDPRFAAGPRSRQAASATRSPVGPIRIDLGFNPRPA